MQKKVLGLVVALVLFVGLPAFIYSLTNNKVSIGFNQGYQPEQPIEFSHAKHAGEREIACQFCHTSTEVSRHASVPSMNICMNCHTAIGGSDEIQQKKIQKLTEAFYDGRPIEWQKVHLLPDHVKFNHAAHIKAEKTCQTCHGPIETMSEVYSYKDLSMGWCVNCHRQPENNANIDCGTCHY